MLLALLYLGVKNIHLGPTLPAFLSPNVAKVLVDNFGIAGITTVDEDLKILMGEGPDRQDLDQKGLDRQGSDQIRFNLVGF